MAGPRRSNSCSVLKDYSVSDRFISFRPCDGFGMPAGFTPPRRGVRAPAPLRSPRAGEQRLLPRALLVRPLPIFPFPLTLALTLTLAFHSGMEARPRCIAEGARLQVTRAECRLASRISCPSQKGACTPRTASHATLSQTKSEGLEPVGGGCFRRCSSRGRREHAPAPLPPDQCFSLPRLCRQGRVARLAARVPLHRGLGRCALRAAGGASVQLAGRKGMGSIWHYQAGGVVCWQLRHRAGALLLCGAGAALPTAVATLL